jgi:hypothetical protein
LSGNDLDKIAGQSPQRQHPGPQSGVAPGGMAFNIGKQQSNIGEQCGG